LHARPGAGEGAAEILEASDERAEATAIADWILRRRGEAAEDEDVPSAAVLVRARRQIPALVDGLEQAGLTAEVVGLGGLLHRPEVAAVRAAPQGAQDPGAGAALSPRLPGPRSGPGARDLAGRGAGVTAWPPAPAAAPPPAPRTTPRPSPWSMRST